MKRKLLFAALLTALTPGLLASGCSVNLDGLGGVFTGITVEVVNDTDLAMDPNIRFDDNKDDFNAFIANLFGAQELTTGTLGPGETARVNFECDELGLILSTGAEQFDLFGQVAETNDTQVLQREDDFNCGAVIRFRFIGTGDDFSVIVTVNGLVVDTQGAD